MSNKQTKRANQPEIAPVPAMANISAAEEAAMVGGARLFVSEFIGSAVPGASSSVNIRGSASGGFVSTSYTLNSAVRSGNTRAGKRSSFFGSIFDFF